MKQQATYYIYTFLLFGFLGVILTTLLNFTSLYLHETASIFIIFLAFIALYFWHPFRYFSLLSQSSIYIFLLIFVVSLWQYTVPFWQTWQGKISDLVSIEEAYKQQDKFTFFRLKNAKINQSQLGTKEYQVVKHYLHGSVQENHLVLLIPMSNKNGANKDFKVWLGDAYPESYRKPAKHFMTNLQSSYQYFMKHPDSAIFQDVLKENKQNANALILIPVSSPQEIFYINIKNMLWVIGLFWLITSIFIAVIELSLILRSKNIFHRKINPANY